MADYYLTYIKYLQVPAVVSLQRDPVVFIVTSTLANATDIYIHLALQKQEDGEWTDTGYEDLQPLLDGTAVFDISDYLEDNFTPAFSYPEHPSNLVIPRPGMIDTFRVRAWETYRDENGDLQSTEETGSYPYGQTFYVLPGGLPDSQLAMLNLMNTDWWTEHKSSQRALTWMPGTKTVSPGSVEKLYWIQDVAATVKLRFTYTTTSGGTGTYDYTFSMSPFIPCELSVSPVLLEELTGKEIAAYSVEIVDRMKAYSYEIDRDEKQWNGHFLATNTFDCFESFWCRGARSGKMDYDRQNYRKTNRKDLLPTGRINGNKRGNLQRGYKSNTGYIEEEWVDWWLDLLNSDRAFKLEGGWYFPVAYTSDSIDFEDQKEEEPAFLEFEWRYGFEGKATGNLGLVPDNVYPPYYYKLSAFFQYIKQGNLVDSTGGQKAAISGTGITWPEITGNDLFDFSDETFWDQDLIAATGWYDSDNPRTCPLSFMQGWAWAEAATATTHARLFHRDYSGTLKSMVPVLAYPPLTEEEQQTVVRWLDWYRAVTESGAVITENGNVVIQK